MSTLAQSTSRYTISGDVRDESGHALAGANVCAIPSEGGIVRVRDRICADTDELGRFKIATLAGRYQVVVDKTSEGYMPQYLPFFRSASTSIPEVNMSDESPTASITLFAGPRGGVITGKVIDETRDVPVEKFTVKLCLPRRPDICHRTIVTSNLGQFMVFTAPGGVTIQVTSEGYEDWFYIDSFRRRPIPLLVPRGITADLAVYLKSRNPASGGPPTSGEAQVSPRLPAPLQLSPQENAVFSHYPRVTRLEWAPVEGAASYAVEVESCNTGPRDDPECFNPHPHFQKFWLVDTTCEFGFIGAQPGRWRVWAVDKERRAGLKSPWRRFVYTI